MQYKALLTWRLQLRARLKMVKQARIAQKFFVQRRYFKLWLVRVKEEQLEKRRRQFEARVAQRFFVGMMMMVLLLTCKRLTWHALDWLVVAQKQRQRKVAEEIVRQRIDMVLDFWPV